MELKKTTPLLSSVPSLFLYRVCMEFRAAVSVSASMWTKLLFLKLESVRPKNWYGLDSCQDVELLLLYLCYIKLCIVQFSSPRTTPESSSNRGTLCGYCFPQLIKICLARIPLPLSLEARYVISWQYCTKVNCAAKNTNCVANCAADNS